MGKGRPVGSLDTNVLLRLLLDDVPLQKRAVEKLLDAGGVFEVADGALFEMVFVLEKVYAMNRILIKENVNVITGNKQFLCNKKLFAHCMPLYVQHENLSIIDCALLTYARLQGATPLCTFDKDLVRVANGDAKIVA